MKNVKNAVVGCRYGFSSVNLKRGETALKDKMASLRKEAEAQIKVGHFGKAEVPVQFDCNGNKVGIANFGMSTMLIENDVGVIVVRFSTFSAAVAETRDFIKMGFACLSEVCRNGDVHISNRGKSVRLSLEAFQGKFSSQIEDLCDGNTAYSSVTVGVKVETASGYKIVRVNPQKALCAIDALARMNVCDAPLEYILAACLDMCAIGRMAGESTIDARKKPTQLVIVGIPGLERLQQIKLLSRQDLAVKIQWSEKITGENCSFERISYRRKVVSTLGEYDIVRQGNGDIRLSSEKGESHLHGESWINNKRDIKTRERIKDIYVCDALQRLRMQGVSRLMSWAEDISTMKDGDDVQKLSLLGNGEEIRRIEEVATDLDKGTGLVAAIRAVGQEYQSATTAAAERERAIEAEANSLKLAPATKMAELDKVRQNKKTVLDALTNKARVVFNAAEAILGKTISPEDRVRVIWAVVLENAKKQGVIEWRALGTLAQNLLGEEYLLWVLDAFRGDPRVQKCTWDKVHPVGIARKMPSDALEMLDGKTVKFVEGEALFKGEPFLRGDDELDGTFKIVVESKDGEVIIWATKDIKDLIVVPKGDPTKTIVKLRQGADAENMDITKAAMSADTVFLFKADAKGNTIATMSDGVIKGVGYYNVPASQAAKKPLCADIGSAFCGVMGTATYVEVIEYFDYQSGKPNNSGFIVLEHLTPAENYFKAAMQ